MSQHTITTAETVLAGRRASPGWVLASLSLSMLLSSLGTSIANVALPSIAEAFGASFQAVQWVVVAYLLAVTTMVVSVGRLGDLIGRRKVLLAGIVLFTAASAFCAVAPNLLALIGARAVQGLGAAAMMAMSMTLVSESVPKAKLGSAMGLLGTMSAAGTALGPSLGGFLISGAGWQSIFLAMAPFGAGAFLLAYFSLPADRPPALSDRPRFDVLGALLLASSLAAYALAMTLGPRYLSVLNLVLISAAICGMGLFIFVEARVASPLVRLSAFRDPVVGSSLAAMALVSTVMMTTLVVGPFYLALGLGLNAASVGITMSVGPLVAALAGVPAGRLVDRFGASRMTVAGLIAIAVGTVALSILPISLGVAGYLAPIVVITAGYALFQAANNTALMTDLLPDQRGVVSGLLNLSRNLGLITGASAMGAVFAFGVASGDITAAPPESITSGMRIAFSTAAALVLVTTGIMVWLPRRPHDPASY